MPLRNVIQPCFYKRRRHQLWKQKTIMSSGFQIRDILNLKELEDVQKEGMLQQDAIITSSYRYIMEQELKRQRTSYYPRQSYSKPSLNPEERLSYPIIVEVQSLNDEYRTADNMKYTHSARSMIYFPRPRSFSGTERCSCIECSSGDIEEEERITIPRIPVRKEYDDDGINACKTPSPVSSIQLSPIDSTTSVQAEKQRSSSSSDTEINEKGNQRTSNSNKTYTCHICDRGFTWFGNFQKHVLTHGDQSQDHPYFSRGDISEDKIIIRESNSTFRCGLCSKTFTRMSGLRTHIRMHNGQRPFKCEHCNLAFTTNRALKMHTRIHSGERPYKCTQCAKTFTRKDELQAHDYLHKGEKPYKCEKCPAAFVRHGHLQRHMLTHAEEKPYKCKDCPKSFTQYRNLQTHMYKHTGERPYKCRFCGKGFTQHGTVQAHERTHTGNKPYACKQCNKRFITSSHLRWHVKKHHQQDELEYVDIESIPLDLKEQ